MSSQYASVSRGRCIQQKPADGQPVPGKDGTGPLLEQGNQFDLGKRGLDLFASVFVLQPGKALFHRAPVPEQLRRAPLMSYLKNGPSQSLGEVWRLEIAVLACWHVSVGTVHAHVAEDVGLIALFFQERAQQLDGAAGNILPVIVFEPVGDLAGIFLEGRHQLIDQGDVLGAAGVERLRNRLGQVQQGNVLGDEGGRLADGTRNLVLPDAFGQFAANVIGNLACGKLVALQVLDDLVDLVVVIVDKGGNRGLAGDPGGAEPARAVIDQVAARPTRVVTHRDRGLDTAQLNGGSKLRNALRGEAGVVVGTGLMGIFVNQAQRQRERSAVTRTRRSAPSKGASTPFAADGLSFRV
jgi:hypothetical protein